MEGAPITIILNVVILVLLGLTIVYAARLSLQLRRLRDSKSDLDRVVRDLIKNLDRAERAIAGLKEAAYDAGADLQRNIDRAVTISDELQVMNESGDRVASRLEVLVDGARPILAGSSAPTAKPERAPTPAVSSAAPAEAGASASSYAKHLRKLEPGDENISRSPFTIRDNDVARGGDPLEVTMQDEEGGALYSEAERDLFRAMKGRAKK